MYMISDVRAKYNEDGASLLPTR